MVKHFTAILAAAVLVGATVSVPHKAEATPAWVIPAVIAAGVGGVVVASVGASAATRTYGYEPAPGSIYVQPRAAATCKIVRERTPSGGWARVEICE